MAFQNKSDWIFITQKGANGLRLPARLMIKHAGGWIDSISIPFALNLAPVEGSAYSCTQGRIKVTLFSHSMNIILSATPVGDEKATLINTESTLQKLATCAAYRSPPLKAQPWPAGQKFPETWGGASSKVPLPYRW